MATVITSECINCGACEPECPNTAIYQGGSQWELNGVQGAALAQDIFFIVPEKCSECVGFFEQEACAAVCPVDCCVPDPNRPESEDVLIQRARQLHPGQEFPPVFPSRFRPKGASAAALPPPAVTRAPSAPPAAAVPSAPAARTAASAVAANEAQADIAAPAATASPGTGAVETAPVVAPPAAHPKAPAPVVAAPKTPAPTPTEAPPHAVAAAEPAPSAESGTFKGELPGSFEDALARLEAPAARPSAWLRAAAKLALPLLGALPYAEKKSLEEAVGDRRIFNAAGATGVNVLHNFVLYPVLFVVLGALAMDPGTFRQQAGLLFVLGLGLAAVESVVRLREAVLRVAGPGDVVYRGALYAAAAASVCAPIIRQLHGTSEQGTIPRDGFFGAGFEEKLERERRYGEVYSLQERPNGYYLRVEFPRRVPPSAIKQQFEVADEMPDYDYRLALSNGVFEVHARLTDPQVRRVAAFSSAFPADFTTRLVLPKPVAGFLYRFRDKTLDVVFPKS